MFSLFTFAVKRQVAKIDKMIDMKKKLIGQNEDNLVEANNTIITARKNMRELKKEIKDYKKSRTTADNLNED